MSLATFPQVASNSTPDYFYQQFELYAPSDCRISRYWLAHSNKLCQAMEVLSILLRSATITMPFRTRDIKDRRSFSWSVFVVESTIKSLMIACCSEGRQHTLFTISGLHSSLVMLCLNCIRKQLPADNKPRENGDVDIVGIMTLQLSFIWYRWTRLRGHSPIFWWP